MSQSTNDPRTCSLDDAIDGTAGPYDSDVGARLHIARLVRKQGAHAVVDAERTWGQITARTRGARSEGSLPRRLFRRDSGLGFRAAAAAVIVAVTVTGSLLLFEGVDRAHALEAAADALRAQTDLATADGSIDREELRELSLQLDSLVKVAADANDISAPARQGVADQLLKVARDIDLSEAERPVETQEFVVRAQLTAETVAADENPALDPLDLDNENSAAPDDENPAALDDETETALVPDNENPPVPDDASLDDENVPAVPDDENPLESPPGELPYIVADEDSNRVIIGDPTPDSAADEEE